MISRCRNLTQGKCSVSAVGGAARPFLLLLVTCLVAVAVQSPRPAWWRADDGLLVIGWTNLSTAHPWLLSYADAPGQWRWETNKLTATNGGLVVSRPMSEHVRMFRLWPAAP